MGNGAVAQKPTRRPELLTYWWLVCSPRTEGRFTSLGLVPFLGAPEHHPGEVVDAFSRARS